MQRTLGYLGLIPFLVTALCVLLSIPLYRLEPIQVFIAYSAVILAFLTGTLWGRSLAIAQSRQQRLLLLSSNMLALVAWFSLLVAQHQQALVLLMLGFAAVLLMELRYNASLAVSYRRLRLQLSALVLLIHGLMFMAANTG